ncbi:hypothetical protein ACFCXK_14565 [Streptomyces sp. NPDC056269]|uniref:hypothetical protein n=1 Tax=Streptomyces sp. NPDC056269 TaxID=3345768 RepID=UPI0035D8DCC1
MSSDPNEPCARDGCTFLPELVMIANMALPAVYCGPGCADFVWLERTLAGAPVTEDTFLAWVGMRKLRDALDARQEPAEIGPLVGS